MTGLPDRPTGIGSGVFLLDFATVSFETGHCRNVFHGGSTFGQIFSGLVVLSNRCFLYGVREFAAGPECTLIAGRNTEAERITVLPKRVDLPMTVVQLSRDDLP